MLIWLGLFAETLFIFLRKVKRACPNVFPVSPWGYVTQHLQRNDYFCNLRRGLARRRLLVMAEDVYRLLQLDREDPAATGLAAYCLLAVLFEEQCEVVDDDSKAGGGGAARVLRLGHLTRQRRVKGLRKVQNILL